MKQLSLSNLEEWSKEDITTVIKMLELFRDGKYSNDFYPEDVAIFKNTDLNIIFMANDEYSVLVYKDGELVSYYTSPYAGIEGTFEELSEQYDEMSEEDKEWFNEVKSARQ